MYLSGKIAFVDSRLFDLEYKEILDINICVQDRVQTFGGRVGSVLRTVLKSESAARGARTTHLC